MTAQKLAEKILNEIGPWDYSVFKNRLEVIRPVLSRALKEAFERGLVTPTLCVDAEREIYEKCAEIADEVGVDSEEGREIARRIRNASPLWVKRYES